MIYRISEPKNHQPVGRTRPRGQQTMLLLDKKQPLAKIVHEIGSMRSINGMHLSEVKAFASS